ncbi:MAG: HAMP domain-containing histidine kinase [Chloroflexaceae bacterium]|nr:HAMP domain-containing histidine kinase [Chloroflexaceae bacterium]
MVALIGASMLAALLIAWELARPLEQLRDCALNTDTLPSRCPIPQNFSIREFKQLAIALNGMVERLRDWGDEIVTAWQEAQNANQVKNQFLATTSHELRTPLNGIIGCLRILREGYCDSREEEGEFLQQADDAAIHLLGIINDILDISRIEAGKLSVSLERVNVCKILKEVIDLQAIPIRKKGLALIVNDCDREIWVTADPAKLKQVLLNVFSNAAKFTESGSIRVSWQIESTAIIPEDGNGNGNGKALGGHLAASQEEWESLSACHHDCLALRVRDTGIGIEPRHQAKLFRPFVMVDGSTTRQFGGTGLGLAISKNLMELMGGSIALFSAGMGQGTTVEIRLPLLSGGHSLPRNSEAIAPLLNN